MQMKISPSTSYKHCHLSITQAVGYHPLVHALRQQTFEKGIHNEFCTLSNLGAKPNFLYLLNSSV